MSLLGINLINDASFNLLDRAYTEWKSNDRWSRDFWIDRKTPVSFRDPAPGSPPHKSDPRFLKVRPKTLE